jgi:hypothetical protein
MAKICKKHRVSFNGIRCPRCTAPPVVRHPDADEVPFEEEGTLVTATPEQVLEVLKKTDLKQHMPEDAE